MEAGYIVKQGLAVIVAFCYSICLFRNFVKTILKVVVCENCVRENQLYLWWPGGKPPAAGQFLQFFQKNFCHSGDLHFFCHSGDSS